MARPKISLPPADAIRAIADQEGRLPVKATPGAREERLEITDGRLCAKVRAKAESGKANKAVQALLADALGIAPSRVQMLRGATSREKLFRIDE
ncbi:MAG: DUF167 domain-containing protein [Novosphingobium sp.]